MADGDHAEFGSRHLDNLRRVVADGAKRSCDIFWDVESRAGPKGLVTVCSPESLVGHSRVGEALETAGRHAAVLADDGDRRLDLDQSARAPLQQRSLHQVSLQRIQQANAAEYGRVRVRLCDPIPGRVLNWIVRRHGPPPVHQRICTGSAVVWSALVATDNVNLVR